MDGSSARVTALALLLAILALELVLSGRGRGVWSALWSGPYPLGDALKIEIKTDKLKAK